MALASPPIDRTFIPSVRVGHASRHRSGTKQGVALARGDPGDKAGRLGQRGPGVAGREVVFAAIETTQSRRRSTSAGRALAMKGRTSTPRRRPAEQRAAGQVPALPMNNTLRSSSRRKLAGFLPLRFTAHFGARRECLLRSGSLRPERRVDWRIIPVAYARLGRTSQVRTAGVIVTTPPARHRHQALRTAPR